MSTDLGAGVERAITTTSAVLEFCGFPPAVTGALGMAASAVGLAPSRTALDHLSARAIDRFEALQRTEAAGLTDTDREAANYRL